MIGVECTPTADAMSQRDNWCGFTTGFTTALRPEPKGDWGGIHPQWCCPEPGAIGGGFTTALRPEPVCDWGWGFMHCD